MKKDTDLVLPQTTEEFYNLRPLLSHKDYNIIIVVAERSNGKSYSALLCVLEDFVDSNYKYQFGYVRRLERHIIGTAGQDIWLGIVRDNKIHELTNGEYNTIVYQRRRWYLGNFNSETLETTKSEHVFGYAFALNIYGQYRSKEYPGIKTVILEEFIPQQNESELSGEMERWASLQSSIVRNRNDVKFVLLGNTTNMYSPYFQFYRLGKLAELNIGEKRFATFVHSSNSSLKLKVVVHRAPGYSMMNGGKIKPSDIYFLPQKGAKMITSGEWDIANYFKLPKKFGLSKPIFTFYISFDNEFIKCDILRCKRELTIYHHLIVSKEPPENSILFTTEDTLNPLHFLCPLDNIPLTKKTSVISELYKKNNITFENDEVGEMVRQYVKRSFTYDALHL